MLWQPGVYPDGLQVEVSTAATMSLGGAPCDPPGAWGKGGLWGICCGHLPSPPYFSWGAILRQFLTYAQVLMTWEGFWIQIVAVG